MKKIYTIIATVAVVFSANAQRMTYVAHPISTVGMPVTSADRTVTDTLVGPSFMTTSYSLATYGVTGDPGGYVNGSNSYGDKEKAQVFINTIGTVGIDGALIWFGAKHRDLAGGATSKVVIKEYSLDGAGTMVSGSVTSGAPGTMHGSVDVLYTAIDTGLSFATGASSYMFATPIIASADFAISVDFSTLAAGDSAGMVSSTQPASGPPGDAAGAEQAWEKWSDNSWHTLLSAWPLDIDEFIWALVDNAAGVNEQGFLNGARLSQNQPNPANSGNTMIGYEIENNTNNVSLMIFDVTGKLVGSYNEGDQAAGKHIINVSTSNLDAGVYYYALTAGKSRIAKKMVIAK